MEKFKLRIGDIEFSDQECAYRDMRKVFLIYGKKNEHFFYSKRVKFLKSKTKNSV